MATYFAPSEWPFIPSGAIPLEGTFLLPVCTTRERLLKMLSILNVWRNVDENDSDYDPIHDIVTALPYIQNPMSSPCMGLSGNDCVDYPTSFTRIIEWIPNNPYAEVQPSYNPWYRLLVDNDITGQRAGDILADLTSIGVDPLEPIPDPSPELPRYRVTVEGTGTLELHMVSVPFGGMAQVQVDGDVLQLTYVDLNQDFASVPPELYSANVWVHEFTTPGVHFVDVTILPRLNDEATAFLGWGGGLRKIVLCGFNEPAAVPMFQFTNECGLEYRFTEADEWTPVPGWTEFAALCFQGPTGAAGEAGAPGQAGPPGYDDDGDVPTPTGAPSEDKRCNVATAIADGALERYQDWLTAWIAVLTDNANDYYAAYNDLVEGAQASLISGAIGAGATGNALPFFIGTALQNVLGIGAIFAGLTAYFAGKDVLNWTAIQTAIADSVFRDEFVCLVMASLGTNGDLTAENWTDIRAGITSLNGASTDAKQDFADFLDASVPVSIARMMALSPVTGADCDHCTDPCSNPYGADHCYTWDFTSSDGGWTLDGFNLGQWVSGEGWKQTTRQQSVRGEYGLRIGKTSSYDFGRTLIRAEVDLFLDVGQRDGSAIGEPFVLHTVVEGTSPVVIQRTTDYDGVLTYAPETGGIELRNGLLVRAAPAVRDSLSAALPVPPGYITLRRVSLWYNGPDAEFTGGTGS